MTVAATVRTSKPVELSPAIGTKAKPPETGAFSNSGKQHPATKSVSRRSHYGQVTFVGSVSLHWLPQNPRFQTEAWTRRNSNPHLLPSQGAVFPLHHGPETILCPERLTDMCIGHTTFGNNFPDWEAGLACQCSRFEYGLFFIQLRDRRPTAPARRTLYRRHPISIRIPRLRLRPKHSLDSFEQPLQIRRRDVLLHHDSSGCCSKIAATPRTR